MNPLQTIHATGIVLGGAGVLVRGPSGAGKSLLALALLERWSLRGDDAMLVADDSIALTQEGRQLIMHTPASIAGRVELRGRGIIERPFRPHAPLHLVVDLVEETIRMPEPASFRTNLGGAALARCPVPRAGLIPLEHQILLVDEAVRGLDLDLL
ncbi:hypothetical protein GCM10007989_17060 [Devosia pacifica]|uniref:HPr kinase/phosphorylase C-terminal domain-containing protein n=1 Tax=Devosia pacifica TaxID=1335967 RepID=A0A918S5E4_9HYPH|nr:hypothetical protein [Devosia pacifica]GHA22262.1 hypothetical protein GCM10007989_17060 [Devosia pacifica]